MATNYKGASLNIKFNMTTFQRRIKSIFPMPWIKGSEKLEQISLEVWIGCIETLLDLFRGASSSFRSNKNLETKLLKKEWQDVLSWLHEYSSFIQIYYKINFKKLARRPIMQCFHKQNLAMRTWRSRALQWEKRDLLSRMQPKCGPNFEVLRTPSCQFHQRML